MERDEYATRAKYDGNKYYTNDEKVDSWNDVDSKLSNNRRRDNHNNGYSDRNNSVNKNINNFSYCFFRLSVRIILIFQDLSPSQKPLEPLTTSKNPKIDQDMFINITPSLR